MEYAQYVYIAAAVICVGGVLYRAGGIFRLPVGSLEAEFSFTQRLMAALSGTASILGNPGRMRLVVRVFLLDVLLQRPVLASSPLSWLMHQFIFWGFSGLLIFHAFESFTSEAVFPGYASTLNPYICARNILGLLVMLGLAIAVYRRRTNTRLRQVTRKGDYIAIILLAMIIGSGFFLEASKIISQPVFDQMMEDFGVMIDAQEEPALEVYWQQAFNVRFDPPLNVSLELMAQGKQIHEDNCAECHTLPGWAVVSYPLSFAMGPVAGFMNHYRFDTLFLILHMLCCITGLIYLPFSKFAHILATPVSLLVKGVTGQTQGLPENQETRRALDLSACTRCGACAIHCAVTPIYDLVKNPWVLPLERLERIRQLTRGRPVPRDSFQAFWEASFLCTGCNTCSALCPAGLDLKNIWNRVRNELTRLSYPDPAVRKRTTELNRNQDHFGAGTVLRVGHQAAPSMAENAMGSLSAIDFSACYTCLTCTNSCPVAGVQDSSFGCGTAPHQVIHLLGLGKKDQAVSAPLVWDCLTCYQCQENCPQGVRITDIFYELRRTAISKAETI